jgi:hypothetical protein
MDASLAKYYLEETDWTGIRESSLKFFLKNKKSLLEVANAVKEAEALIYQFEDKHWIPYLCNYWNKSTKRGHKAEVNGIKTMMWGCAGRVLITAENKEGSVTMIFSDELQDGESIEKWGRMRGGIQGFGTTRDNALMMLKNLVETDKLEFSNDDDVRLAGL